MPNSLAAAEALSLPFEVDDINEPWRFADNIDLAEEIYNQLMPDGDTAPIGLATVRAWPAFTRDSAAPAPAGAESGYALPDHDIVMEESDTPYTLRVRDLAPQDKPREKLLQYGPGELSLAEIVAVLLGTGTRREEVLQMAHRILKEYGERAIVHETNPKYLAETLDIPLVKACQLVASFELGRRFYQNRAGKPVVVRTSRQAYQHLRGMGDLQKEQLRALYLGSRYQVVHEEVVSMGSLTANIVHPREVFQPAITYGAVAVIIAHNHPSGSLEATEADAEVTYQLIEGGKLLGIELLDHLIIAGDSYISMMEEEK